MSKAEDDKELKDAQVEMDGVGGGEEKGDGTGMEEIKDREVYGEGWQYMGPKGDQRCIKYPLVSLKFSLSLPVPICGYVRVRTKINMGKGVIKESVVGQTETCIKSSNPVRHLY